MAEYWKLIDFGNRTLHTLETEEETVSLIHSIIRDDIPEGEWGDFEITSTKLTIPHIGYTYTLYVAQSDKHLRFYIYYYDSYEEELDDELDENRGLHKKIAELISERSEWAEEYADRIRSIESEYAIDALQKQINSLQVMNASLKKDLKYKDNCIKEQREHINSLKQQSDAQKKRIDILTEYNDKLRELNYRLKKAFGQIYGTCLESGEVGDDL